MRDTIDMAREAGLSPDALAVQFLKRFEALVRADERKQVALDKKAENARELGLDYEPVAQYSDIVSDGGLDPRNKFDTTPPAAQQDIQRLSALVRAQQITIDKLEQALAAPVQEPVAWMVYTQDGKSVYVTDNPTDIQEGQRALPLYTTPPAAQRQWVELTDEEIDKTYETQIWDARRSYARAIEAKLKEKNQ